MRKWPRGGLGSASYGAPLVLLALSGALSCGVDRPDSSRSEESAPAVTPPARDDRTDDLVDAAENIVRFLRGEGDFDQIATGDTVTLHLSPEGGGTQAKIPRELLRDPANWAVPSAGSQGTYRFAPPARMVNLTTRAGTHFNCLEYPLSSLFPDLAALPHVGAKLEPSELESCLQTWNVTFVFDPREGTPVLVAAVYDQWEW